jgi:hypothetical protein
MRGKSPRGQLSTSKDERYGGASASVGTRGVGRDSALEVGKGNVAQQRRRGQQALRHQSDRRKDGDRQRTRTHRHTAGRVVMLGQRGVSVQTYDAKDNDCSDQRRHATMAHQKPVDTPRPQHAPDVRRQPPDRLRGAGLRPYAGGLLTTPRERRSTSSAGLVVPASPAQVRHILLAQARRASVLRSVR